MEPIVCAFTLPYRYEVLFTRGAFQPSNETVRNVLAAIAPRRLLVALEEAVARANPALQAEVENYLTGSGFSASLHLLPGGEPAKGNDFQVKRLYQIIEEKQLCRHSCVIAIGGGAFLDVAGFAAATMHRGIKLIRFPSTLLSQADGGVGVKNGINFDGKKNLVGTFAPPVAVINDLDLLATLPPGELRSGLSEAVKVGLIRDAAFFDWLETRADRLRGGQSVEIEILARQCASLHVRHIAGGGDPFEQGSSRPLDFGHWAAHKLEQMSGFSLRHGEAVAVGMALDSVYAVKAGFLPASAMHRILKLLAALGLPVFCADLLKTGELIRGLDEFREHLGGKLCIPLLRRIGRSFEVNEMDPALIVAAVEELKKQPGSQPG